MTIKEFIKDDNGLKANVSSFYDPDKDEYQQILSADRALEFARHHVVQCIKKIVKDNPGSMNQADIPYLLKSYPPEEIK